jgi:hypothetical protein
MSLALEGKWAGPADPKPSWAYGGGRVAIDRFGGDASIWFLFIMWSKLSLNFVYFIFVPNALNLNLTSNFKCGLEIQIYALKYF